MRGPESGSTPWLVRHELRLSWRGLRLLRWPWPVQVLTLVAIQAAGFALAWSMTTKATPDRQVAALLSSLASSLSFVAVSTTLMVTMSIYKRQDLAWLLTAPMPFRRLLPAIMAGIALRPPMMIMAAPVVAIVNGLVLLGWVSALAAYPVMFGVALVVVSAALWIVVGLASSLRASWVEPGARVVAFGLMVVSLAVVGADVGAKQQAAADRVDGVGASAIGETVARAMLGEPGPLALVAGVCLAVTLVTARALERRFVAGALSGLAVRTPARRQRGVRLAFRPGPRAALFWKECRLLRRTPNVAVDALLRTAILLPLYFLNPSGAGVTPSRMVVFLVCGAGQLARVMMSATIANDGDGDFTRTAPVSGRVAQGMKAAVAACGIALFLTPPCALVAWQAPGLLAPLLAGLVGSAGSAMLMTLRRPAIAARSDLGGIAGRLSGSGWRILVVSLLWAGAVQAAAWALGLN